MNDSGIEMAELSFEGLDGASCNLTVTTTGPEYIEQCLEDIEITNMSKQTYNTTVLCIKCLVDIKFKQVAYLIGAVFLLLVLLCA